MSLQVSAENEQFLQQQVETGFYSTKDAALDAAIDLLKRTASLRTQIDCGVRQLESGDFLEFDENSLDGYFDQLLAVATGAEPQQ